MPKCFGCNAEVDFHAAVCPWCGRPNPGKEELKAIGAMIILVVALGLFFLPAIIVILPFSNGFFNALEIAIGSFWAWAGSAVFWVGLGVVIYDAKFRPTNTSSDAAGNPPPVPTTQGRDESFDDSDSPQEVPYERMPPPVPSTIVKNSNALRFLCPNCHKRLRVHCKAAGHRVKCPHCLSSCVAPSLRTTAENGPGDLNFSVDTRQIQEQSSRNTRQQSTPPPVPPPIPVPQLPTNDDDGLVFFYDDSDDK